MESAGFNIPIRPAELDRRLGGGGDLDFVDFCRFSSFLIFPDNFGSPELFQDVPDPSGIIFG